MNEIYADSPALASHHDLPFEGKRVTAYVFRGRLTWIAINVGDALGYDNGGKDLPDVIRKAWSDEFVEGVDFAVLTGEELKEFKAVMGLTERHSVSRAPALMVLYETGLDLVCLRTERPLGKKLRRMIAEEVLPKLRRGDTILPAGAAAPPALPVHVIEMQVASQFIEASRGLLALMSPAVSQEAKDAAIANVFAKATGARVVPLLPQLPAGEWLRPEEIARRATKQLGWDVNSSNVGRAITALGLRGDKEHCRTVMDQKSHADGQVEAHMYDEHAVTRIIEHIAANPPKRVKKAQAGEVSP
jgi:prophage antirepressor-like protein